MEELKAVLDFIKIYGISGVVTAVLVWDKFIKPRRKKAAGEWVSYKDMDTAITANALRLIKLEVKVDNRLEKATEEEIKMERMHVNLNNLEERVSRENNYLFKQFESIHAKMDTLFQAILDLSKKK